MSDIVFVDFRVTDAQALIDQLTGQGMEIHTLDANSDGVEQMATFLTGRTDVGAIHVLSHGSSGALQLGSGMLDADGIASHAAALTAIGASLVEGGDLLLYGSSVASGQDGTDFIDALSAATGADVAASDDTTGSSGNWNLEASSGDIETSAIDGSGVEIAALDATDDVDGDDDVTSEDDNGGDEDNHDFAGDEDGEDAEGGDGDDEMDGGGGDDHLEGGRGNDHIMGGLGRDSASYLHASGHVSVHLSNHQAEDDGDGGVDTLDGIEDLHGSTHDDDLGGDEGDNDLEGDEGDDLLEGGAGNDHLAGGVGRDRASYEHALHHVVADLSQGTADDGDGGTDTLDSIEDLKGSSFDDDLGGNDESNTLEGDAGNDELDGRQGDDDLDGGDGIDTASYVDAAGAVTASLATGQISDGDGGTDTVIHIENVHGGHYNDSLSGDAGDNQLDGDLGNDSLRGGAGHDELNGGRGNDRLDGGKGSDVLNGGKGDDRLDGGDGSDTMAGGVGDDTYVVNSSGDVINESSTLSTEIDSVLASVSFKLGDHLEHLTLTGTNAINGSGNDLANWLDGNDAANLLSGGRGDDTLDGGKGLDVLTGGKGHDIFRFDSTLSSKSNVDHISDFNAADDNFALDNADFTHIGKAGALASGAFHAGHAAHDSNDRIIYDESNGHLLYDADGNGSGAAVLFATVNAHTALTSADIWVV